MRARRIAHRASPIDRLTCEASTAASGTAIVGSATNKTGADTTGPFGVQVCCFDGDTLLSSRLSFAEQTGDVADGGTVTYSADLFDDTCPTFTVGVSGYFA